MTAAGATTYQWDGANRLKSVNGGTSGSYGFDGNGKRVKKTEGGASTYYVYSSVMGSAVMEVASAGVQRAYVMNGGSVVAQRNPDGNFYWLHMDHLGSGRKMTNTSGNLAYRAEFDPYGKLTYEWSATPNLNTKKFTGYERDAGSGLDYAQARMYGSEWGRFLSPDPIGLASANKQSPMTLNRYSYTNGNPINLIDPDGTDSRDFRSTSSRTFDTWRGWTGPLGGSFGYNNGFGNFFGTTAADFDFDYFSYAATLIDYLSKVYEPAKPAKVLLSMIQAEGKHSTSKCGGGKYVINWDVLSIGGNTSSINGWVVQHLKISATAVDRQGRDSLPKYIDSFTEYWEAWEVKNGVVYAGKFSESGGAHGTDTFSSDYDLPFTIGTFSFEGKAKFVDYGELSPDPARWGKLPDYAGVLPATKRSPNGWTDLGTIDHEYKIQWNCLN